jgi:tetratricopeptide (TPR) repeat protein
VHASTSTLLGSPLQGADAERLSAALRYLWPIDRPLVNGLARAGRQLSFRADTEPPHSVVADLLAHVEGLKGLLSRSQPESLAAELRRLASTAAHHAGYLSDVSGRRGEAYTHFALAESLAREAESGTQLAQFLVNKAEAHRRRSRGPEDLGPSLTLTRAAELAVGPDAPAGLRAWILGELATHAAEAGDLRASGRFLERAYGVATVARAEEMNLWAPDLESAWLEEYRGFCALRLGEADEAIETYEAVLRSTDPRLLWERVRALSQLASAWLLKEEVERACGLLLQAVELAGASGDLRGLQAALGVREHQLGRWRWDPKVQDLDEAIRLARR